MRQRPIDWNPFRYPISYLCKLYYLAYMVTFSLHHMPGMMFAFSVWIINDQYEKTWTDSAVRRFARELGAHLPELLCLAQADITTKRPEKKRR